jgi:hypothetical protein
MIITPEILEGIERAEDEEVRVALEKARQDTKDFARKEREGEKIDGDLMEFRLMTPREKLDAAHAKPPTAEDVDAAVACMIDVDQQAKLIKRLRGGRMDHPVMDGAEVVGFANRVLDLVYHARWMVRKLRNQLEEKPS